MDDAIVRDEIGVNNLRNIIQHDAIAADIYLDS